MRLDEIKDFCSRYMLYLKTVAKNSSNFKHYTISFTKYIKANFKFLKQYEDPYMNVLVSYISTKQVMTKNYKVTKENLLFMFNALYNLYLTIIGDYSVPLSGEYHREVYKKLYDTIYSNYTKKVVSEKKKTEKKNHEDTTIKQNNIINFSDL